MTFENLITEYAESSDITKMEQITKVISDFVESNATGAEKRALMKKVYGIVGGGHFNKYFADEQITAMYYVGDGGSNHYAPYWTEGELRTIFDEVEEKIAPYNLYDFMVVMNMVKSDQYLKLKRWFPDYSEESIFDKIIDEAVNWLVDEDNPFGDKKVWGYFNGCAQS